LAISKQIGDRNSEGSALGNLGITYRVLGQNSKAIDFYQQSLDIFKQIGYREGEGKSLNNLGYLFAIQNHPELAIFFYKQSINVRESIRKDIRTLNKEEQKSYLETVAFSYKRLADLLLKQDRVIEALQVLDLLKVQELEDYLKNIKGNDRTSQGVRLFEPERLMATQNLAINYEQMAERSRQLTNQIKQLPKAEIDKTPDYLQQLPKGTVLSYPLILEDRLEIILFAPNTPPIHRAVPIKRSELEVIVIEFLWNLRDLTSEDFLEDSQRIYNLLLKPIETDLKNAQAKTILYAPDGMLRYIPITALHDGKKFLIEEYAVNNLIAYILSDFTPKTKAKIRILAGAFGGKQSKENFGQSALPATLVEVQEIQKILQNSTVLKEAEFSRRSIETQIPNHTILHLATHASFNTGAPDKSFILFGNGDTIRLNEISDLKMSNLDLIVLSACQTAVGKLGNGVEILGFGYQVQKAGAKSAIASLWKVSDIGTQVLMEAFYGELTKDNMTSSEALRRAQISLIRSSKYNHPNYWAAFFVIGNGL
jgi:CHAT domain-containing protein